MSSPLRVSVQKGLAATVGSPTDVQVSVRVPTDLEVVEEAVDVVARHCVTTGLPPRRARFNLRVALCEALSNAIIYGNQLDPAKEVTVEVHATDHHVTIQVRDEGNGFDPAAVPEPSLPDDLEATGGRGLFLIRKLVDDVYFNDQGNAICMVLRRA